MQPVPWLSCRQEAQGLLDLWGGGRSVVSSCSYLHSTSPSIAFGISVVFKKELSCGLQSCPSLGAPSSVALGWRVLPICAQLGLPNGVCVCAPRPTLFKPGEEMAPAGFSDIRLSCEQAWLGTTCICWPAGPTKGRGRVLAVVPVSTSFMQGESKPSPARTVGELR